MRELSVIEIEEVAGAYGNGFFADIGEAMRSAVVGGAAGFCAGSIIGGKHGGDGGGFLGIGAIGQGVGMIYGGITGGIACALGGAAVGWDKTWAATDEVIKGFASGTLIP
ncbi:hypothetical protein [Erwinia sp. HR93]|uniref:hypothetical protein n=1 Tax=Erwinia sp. HR93 TaxID=3094840 RepID=UPI002ADEE8C1|nr:hypothetical protein [Erwinia sp. HR93]MEA1063278.1 hypothetical protein [Erwinia sp. HR93]